MSKKFEYIKDAVFHSEQKPENLANLLEGLIADVATSVSVAGESSITIPSGDTSATSTYTAEVLSQFGDAMTGNSVTWSATSATGVSINSSTGVLSVEKTASAGSIVVTATSNSLTGSIEVTLVAEP